MSKRITNKRLMYLNSIIEKAGLNWTTKHMAELAQATEAERKYAAKLEALLLRVQVAMGIKNLPAQLMADIKETLDEHRT